MAGIKCIEHRWGATPRSGDRAACKPLGQLFMPSQKFLTDEKKLLL